VFSSGGGTQSIAAQVLVLQGKLRRPDIIVIADTGREMPTTWNYFNEVTLPAFQKTGIPIFRVKSSEWSYKCYTNGGAFTEPTKEGVDSHLQIPAFSNINGAVSKLKPFCSKAWKREAIQRFLTIKFGIKRSKYKNWICFSIDETNRVLRIKEGGDFKKGLVYLPLVDLMIKRQDAIQIVKKFGWPEPPRSRCFDCPNQTDYEWTEVAENFPKEFKSACDRDDYIRTRDKNAFLHSTLTPLRSVDLSKKDDLFSGGCPSGECFL